MTCIVRHSEGNEVQQLLYVPRSFIHSKSWNVVDVSVQGREILSGSECESFSMNIGKRFWPSDNTDIKPNVSGIQKKVRQPRELQQGSLKILGLQLRYSVCQLLYAGGFYPSCVHDGYRIPESKSGKPLCLPYVLIRNRSLMIRQP